MKRTLLGALLFSIVACADDPDPPSCVQGFTHFYAAGCDYRSLATGAVIPVQEMIANCQNLAATAPSEKCSSRLQDWITCNFEVRSPASSDADCDCSQTGMAVLTCQQ